jgi:FkbM family methyltransferase
MNNLYSKEYYRTKRWFGLKKYAKKLLLFKPINILIIIIAKTFLPIAIRKRVPIVQKDVAVKVGNQKFYMLDPARCSIAKEIAWCDGVLDETKTRFALNMFCDLAIEHNVMLDIGANTGLFSLAVATVNSTISVSAYEIVPDVYSLLFKNVCRNDLLKRVTPYCRGIGDGKDLVKMPFTCEDSALPSSYSSKWDFPNGVMIPVISLNDILSDYNKTDKVIIKIDVEGTESDIFKNADTFIKSLLPDILCEIQTWAQDTGAVDVILKQNNYNRYNIQDGYLLYSNQLYADPLYHDWFFTQKNVFQMREKFEVKEN